MKPQYKPQYTGIWEIQVLTRTGIKIFMYDQAKDKTLRELAAEISKEHGTFITLKSEKIK